MSFHTEGSAEAGENCPKDRVDELETEVAAQKIYIASCQKGGETADRHVYLLTEMVKELVAAMRRYEMDVDEPAPGVHKGMIERAEFILKAVQETYS